MVEKDCDCILLGTAGQPAPNCLTCGGTGGVPPSAVARRDMRNNALRTLAAAGNRGALRKLAQTGDHLRPVR